MTQDSDDITLLEDYSGMIKSGDYADAAHLLAAGNGFSAHWTGTAVDLDMLDAAAAADFLKWFAGSIHGLNERELIDNLWPAKGEDPDDMDIE
jgi:hypothetical protein